MGDTGRILLARHGQTRWNVEDRRQGRSDIPLDEVGLAQAETLRALLADERIDRIYASPLRRSLTTAGAVAHSRGLEAVVDADLIEFDYGDFSGSVRSELRLKLRRDFLHIPVPGGESLADVWARAGQFVERVRPLLASTRLLIVGHQRLNRLLLGRLSGRTLEEAAAANDYRPATGSVLAITLDFTGPQMRVVEQRILASRLLE
jgi:broad specificity phosphatase PhoE